MRISVNVSRTAKFDVRDFWTWMLCQMDAVCIFVHHFSWSRNMTLVTYKHLLSSLILPLYRCKCQTCLYLLHGSCPVCFLTTSKNSCNLLHFWNNFRQSSIVNFVFVIVSCLNTNWCIFLFFFGGNSSHSTTPYAPSFRSSIRQNSTFIWIGRVILVPNKVKEIAGVNSGLFKSTYPKTCT